MRFLRIFKNYLFGHVGSACVGSGCGAGAHIAALELSSPMACRILFP